MVNIIKYVGYLPFGNGLSDSHRTMFINLQTKNIQREEDNTFKHRNLRSTHPFKAPKFIKIVVEQTSKFNILKKLQELNEKVHRDKEQANTKVFTRNLEIIDSLVISAFLTAEKRCGLMCTNI